MQLEKAINILNNKIYSLNENIKIYDKGYDLSIKNELVKEKEAIETVLQEYEKLLKESNNLTISVLETIVEKVDLQNNSIPKKKIEDKIKIYRKDREKYDKEEKTEWGEFNSWEWIGYFINELQELLEGK